MTAWERAGGEGRERERASPCLTPRRPCGTAKPRARGHQAPVPALPPPANSPRTWRHSPEGPLCPKVLERNCHRSQQRFSHQVPTHNIGSAVGSFPDHPTDKKEDRVGNCPQTWLLTLWVYLHVHRWPRPPGPSSSQRLFPVRSRTALTAR